MTYYVENFSFSNFMVCNISILNGCRRIKIDVNQIAEHDAIDINISIQFISIVLDSVVPIKFIINDGKHDNIVIHRLLYVDL